MEKEQIVLAIHEASGQDITFQNDVAYSLTTGGASQDKDIRAYSSLTVIGTDMFNFNLTGTASGTLRGQRVDVINTPCILIVYEKKNSDG